VLQLPAIKRGITQTSGDPVFPGGSFVEESMMLLYKKSRFTLDLLIKHNNSNLQALYQTLTGAFILISAKDYSKIHNDTHVTTDPAIVDTLCTQGFLVASDVDETRLFEIWKQQYVYEFSTLKSKILVTRKCNNRCRYCIIDPEAKEMSPETARAMDQFYIDVIMERNPLRVRDDFLGGEPFLNTKVVLDSAQRRFFFCKGKGIDYGFTVTTNGTLITETVVSEMTTVGLTGMRVSLAGPAQIHDRLRPSLGDGKTYERIMRNLQAVSGLIPVDIECQYDSGAPDFHSIPEMLDDMAERNIQIGNIAFTPILPRREDSPFYAGMGDPNIALYLKKEAAKRGYPVNDEAPSNACMTDFRSIYVFDTDGSIIPCPSLQGGEMAYGNVLTGIDLVAESQLLHRKLPDQCLNQCELLPICMGGCRLQALTRHNDFNGIDCHYDTYRSLLEDYMRAQAAVALSQNGFRSNEKV